MSRRFRICMAKGGRESVKAELWTPEVDPYFERKKLPSAVLQKMYIKEFSREDFAPKSKL